MEVMPGTKKNSNIYIYDDHVYHNDCRYVNIFRCTKRQRMKCCGAVMLLDNNIHLLQEHNHAPSKFVKEQMEMKEEILRLSRNTYIGFKEIFDSVCRSNPDAAQYLSFSSLRCSMVRERMKSRPPVPDTLASLQNILENCDIIKNVYKESITTNDGKTAIILSSNYLLEALSSATEIYVDGTFSVLPQKPHIAQLYSIHIRYMDTGIATLFILCDVRTTNMYDVLWDKITQLVPQLEQNINFIMSDFEIAAVKSLSTKFPRAKLTGCWFHFNQAVLRKWRKLHLLNAPKTVLSMTMALPLLPPEMFHEALFIIQTEADSISSEYPIILQFTSYLRLTWSNMASKISTYNCPVRTNNIVESFHNTAVQKLGKRNINIWTFLEKLSNLITDQELDFRRLKNGIRSRRNRSRANRERDTKIVNAQQDLVNKRLPLKDFLLMFSTNIDIFQMEQMPLLEDTESSNIVQAADMELFADNLDTLQAERQNFIRRRSRNANSSRRESSRRREANASRRDADQNTDNSSNTQTEVTHAILQPTREEPETVDITLEIEFSNMQDQNAENSPDIQTEITHATVMQTTHEEFETIDITSHSETYSENLNIEDPSIYETPEDDYGYTNTDDSNASVDVPYHAVDWTLQDSEDTSKEKSSSDTCILCYSNERTHLFIPCGHLACCFQCIKRLEANRCPICNLNYQNFVRVIKS